MLNITTRIGTQKYSLQSPQAMREMTVEQFQNIVGKWDFEDWIQVFSIITGLKATDIASSSDGSVEGALYEAIAFLLDKREWEKLNTLPIPKTLELRPLWQKDCPLLVDTVTIPRKLGGMTIGQKIQARKSIEDVKDIREGLSIVTAIYLQPLIDKGKFDMLRVIEIESVIAKMPLTRIYPIGFFLLRQLRITGNWRTKLWSLIRNLLHIKGVRIF